uniref:ABC transporter ATP-binding protein n=1 Tax=Coprococcus sp. TaxID=2049024 RepID=UPI003FEED434
MNQDVAIEVQHISKSFKISYDKSKTLKDKIIFAKKDKYEIHHVLDDVSFTIKKGEAVGLIGHNGCGKSTTLKLLTRIIYPDSGEINIDGRVSSLLELGAGFHPDMTGRENIYTNASIFGLTKKEIDERLDEIIEFSELEEFIDNPVRTYSSGMYMRLAFSVAINVNADILLIDEILAVGDSNFQLKCANKMQELKKEGITIVIVSHSMGQIEELCDRCIWLDKGKIVSDGTPQYVHKLYMEFMGQARAERSEKERQLMEEAKNLDLSITKVECKNNAGEPRVAFSIDDDINITLYYKIKSPRKVAVQFTVFRSDYMMCYERRTDAEKETVLLEGEGKIQLKLKNVQLLLGHYMIDFSFYTEEGHLINSFERICQFDVYADVEERGMFRMKHQWEF